VLYDHSCAGMKKVGSAPEAGTVIPGHLQGASPRPSSGWDLEMQSTHTGKNSFCSSVPVELGPTPGLFGDGTGINNKTILH
jgi:hypothetical protein